MYTIMIKFNLDSKQILSNRILHKNKIEGDEHETGKITRHY